MKRVSLIGFDNFGTETIEDVKRKVKPLINRYDKIFGSDKIQGFKLALKTFKKDGVKDLHELTMSLNTTKGDFRGKKQGWEVLSLVDEVESVLERQIKKMKGKMLEQRKDRNA